MMALRQTPTEYAFVHALEVSSGPKPLPRWVMLAVGASLLLHLGVVAYIYNQRFVVPHEDGGAAPATRMTIWRLPIPTPDQTSPTKPERLLGVHHPVENTITTTETLKTPLTADQQKVVTNDASGFDFQPFTPPIWQPKLIRDPTWVSRPSAAEMARFYPARAIDENLAGQAVLSCPVTAAGRLIGCRIVSETPTGAGFGEAAVKLSAFFKMNPRTEDDQPVDGGTIQIPILFRLQAAQ
jgi:protein TonB